MSISKDPVDAPSSSSFKILLSEFLAATGHPAPDHLGANGIELTCEDYVVRIYTHPANAEEVVIDIHIFEMGFAEPEVDAQRFLFLHRLNESSRFSNGWLATLSAEDILLLTRSVRIGEINGAALAELVGDGLDCAESFAEGWLSLRDLLEGDSSTTPKGNDPLLRV